MYFIQTFVAEVVYCAAVDNIGDRLVGCNNLVEGSDVCMVRPSTRLPYSILCVVHRNRMLRHNCCPTCGLFCTQVRRQSGILFLFLWVYTKIYWNRFNILYYKQHFSFQAIRIVFLLCSCNMIKCMPRNAGNTLMCGYFNLQVLALNYVNTLNRS